MVVNPADVPTKDKKRSGKTDKVIAASLPAASGTANSKEEVFGVPSGSFLICVKNYAWIAG
jgi:hypothetical protein